MKRSKEMGSQRLIDYLAASPDVGALRGILATTFDLNADFFETDFLPGIFGLGAWDDRRYASRIAMERALAQTDAVAIFMDARRYQGRPRSLRVDVMPAVGDGGQILHAKIVLLIYEAAVRLIVTSANLTESGYRLNREVALALKATKSDPKQGALIRSALQPMPKVCSAWWSKSAEKLHQLALHQLDEWQAPPLSMEEEFLWSGDAKPLFESVLESWPQDEPIQRISIVSPFWSEERGRGPITALIQGISTRKLCGNALALRLLTEAEQTTQTSFRPVLPESFRAFDGRVLGVDAKAYAVDPSVEREDTGGREEVLRRRALHAKVVLFEGPKTAMAYIGSANFTAQGWGFLSNPRRANLEAGVLIRRTGKERAILEALLPKTTGNPVVLAGAAAAWLALPAPSEEPAPWPAFLRTACLSPEPSNPDRLGLQLRVEPDAVEGAWSVQLPMSNGVLIRHDSGKALSEYRVSLGEEALRELLHKQVLLVSFWARQDAVEFPINVELEARPALPLSPGDGRPGEKALLAYYQGRIGWEDLFPSDTDGDERTTGSGAHELSSEVDKSNIQSYQIREFVEALRGIRDDLRACAEVSEGAIRLAVLGPVSPVALGQEVMRAVRAKKRSPVAGGFQILELIACLAEAKGFSVKEALSAAWIEHLDQALAKLESLFGELKQYDNQELGHPSFKAYEGVARRQGGQP